MDAFIGEIRIFGGNYAPAGWALCNGQVLPIAQYSTLFSILGNRYGGNGQTNFALPNLNGRVPVGAGAGPGLTSRELGEMDGSPSVTLLATEMPAHTHTANGVAGNGTTQSPANTEWAQYNTTSRPAVHAPLYGAAADVVMAPTALGVSGGSQPHNNMQPFLAMNFIISLEGQFPPHP